MSFNFNTIDMYDGTVNVSYACWQLIFKKIEVEPKNAHSIKIINLKIAFKRH